MAGSVLWQTIEAERRLTEKGARFRGFFRDKLQGYQYFYRYKLPGVFATFWLVASLDDAAAMMQAEMFTGNF